MASEGSGDAVLVDTAQLNEVRRLHAVNTVPCNPPPCTSPAPSCRVRLVGTAAGQARMAAPCTMPRPVRGPRPASIAHSIPSMQAQTFAFLPGYTRR